MSRYRYRYSSPSPLSVLGVFAGMFILYLAFLAAAVTGICLIVKAVLL